MFYRSKRREQRNADSSTEGNGEGFLEEIAEGTERRGGEFSVSSFQISVGRGREKGEGGPGF